jgi:hypothetical protein
MTESEKDSTPSKGDGTESRSRRVRRTVAFSTIAALAVGSAVLGARAKKGSSDGKDDK